ncbi:MULTISPECIES: hypothetical protein [Thermomonosporaceae]|uniref:hypothetical protein n=1 Tax=Thermomonosporaceae TaxID=2012 RepID=UPI00255AC5B3|nr:MULTISPECIES: hypothetical protein [Thermomonosporaceae]MDL4775909.1 hypothetical protein [Actinomadura xylanilytica]
MDRKKFGLFVVAFVLVVGAMEIFALQIGSMDFPLPDQPQKPVVAENQGVG